MSQLSQIEVYVPEEEAVTAVKKIAAEYAEKRLPKGVVITEVLKADFVDDGYAVTLLVEE